MISASILSADFFNLYNIINAINASKFVEYIHFDIMDGHFVDEISFGYNIAEKISLHVEKKIDTHLMVENPLEQAKKFVKFSDILTLHYEALNPRQIKDFLQICKDNNCKAGIAIRPSSSFGEIEDLIELFDVLTVMTVEPGKGGQLFLNSQIEKIQKIDEYIKRKNFQKKIEIDGGVNGKNIKDLNNLKIINTFVVGSFFIKNIDNFDEIMLRILH